MKKEKHPTKAFAAFALFCGVSLSAHAQIGSGWTPTTETPTIQTSAGCTAVPLPSSSGIGGVFNIPTSTPTGNDFRAEFRFPDLSASTTEQFQGDVTVNSLSGDRVTIKQTFGPEPSTPWNLIAVTKANGGQLYEVEGGAILAAYTIGTSVRINTIYNPTGGPGAVRVDVYINGAHAEQITTGTGPNYNKVGAYASSSGAGPCQTTWQNILFWTGGSSAGGTTVVDPPSFSPASGTYTSAQSVTLSSTTAGASIAYTTDGSTPTEAGGSVTHGTLYSTPVAVGATGTLKAIAYETGLADSGVSAAAYIIQIPASSGSGSSGTSPAPSGGGGGGAFDDWFLGFVAFAGLWRWRLRKRL